jgi:hypothetical protein
MRPRRVMPGGNATAHLRFQTAVIRCSFARPNRVDHPPGRNESPMLKLLGIIVAAMPIILFVRAMFIGSRRRAEAVSNFRRQLDYTVWLILLMIGLVLVFSIGKLILELGTIAPR